MSATVLHVFVFRDGAYVGSEIFTEPEIVVGSGDGADLLLDDPGVADAHAIISRDETQLSLLDLGHGRGSRVNGSEVQHASVGPRDEIALGRHLLKLKLVRPKAAGGPSARPSIPPLAPPPRAPTADLAVPDPVPARPMGQAVIPTEPVRDRPLDDIDAILERELQADLGDSTAVIVDGDVLSESPLASAPADEGGYFGSLDEALASAFSATPEEPADEAATVAAPLSRLVDPRDPAAVALEASFVGEETEATPLHRPAVAEALGASAHTSADDLSVPPLATTPPEPRPGPQPPERQALPPAPRSPSEQTAPEFNTGSDADRSAPEVAPSPSVERSYGPDDDEVDEDELEAHELPGFSLLEELVRSGQARGEHARKLEIIHSDRGEVRRVDQLGAGGPMKLTAVSPMLRRARVDKTGAVQVWFAHDTAGVLIEDGRKIPLDNLKVPERAVSKKSDAYALDLRPGQSLTLRSGTAGVHLRFVEPPPLPPAPPSPDGPEWRGPVPRALGMSVVVHALVGLFVAATATGATFAEKPREVWAEVDLEEIRPVEVPEPEPIPEPEPEPVAEAPPPAPKKKVTPPPSPKRQKERAAPKGKSPAVVKKAGVLGGLAKLGQKTPGKKSMVAAVSNIDAVKAPGSSSFRTGGLIGKAPTSEIRLGGGGGGKPLTRGSADLLRGGAGFARIGKQSGTKVRGKVGRVVARRVKAQGQISKAELAKVLNAHMNEVQSCYERALMSGNPGLRGKLTVEWTIRANGRASAVKQKFSTLKDSSVARCIMTKLKTWRFPKPRGGVVVVSYPFNFAATSY